MNRFKKALLHGLTLAAMAVIPFGASVEGACGSEGVYYPTGPNSRSTNPIRGEHRGEPGEFRHEARERIEEFRRENPEFRQEARERIGEFRREHPEFRQEAKERLGEFRRENPEFRQEARERIQEFRQERREQEGTSGIKEWFGYGEDRGNRPSGEFQREGRRHHEGDFRPGMKGYREGVNYRDDRNINPERKEYYERKYPHRQTFEAPSYTQCESNTSQSDAPYSELNVQTAGLFFGGCSDCYYDGYYPYYYGSPYSYRPYYYHHYYHPYYRPYYYYNW